MQIFYGTKREKKREGAAKSHLKRNILEMKANWNLHFWIIIKLVLLSEKSTEFATICCKGLSLLLKSPDMSPSLQHLHDDRAGFAALGTKDREGSEAGKPDHCLHPIFHSAVYIPLNIWIKILLNDHQPSHKLWVHFLGAMREWAKSALPSQKVKWKEKQTRRPESIGLRPLIAELFWSVT